MAFSVNNLPFLKKKDEKPVFVEKKTMNFAMHENPFDIKKMAPILVVLALIFVVFLKFGFLDQISKKTGVYAELAGVQAEIEMQNAKLAEYDKLAEKHGRYSYSWMSESEIKTVNRIEVMDLIEKNIMTKATVDDFSIANNAVSLNLSNISLKDASAIVDILEQEPLVKKVSVFSASAPDADRAQILMSIVLQNKEEETTIQEATTVNE